MDVDTVPALLYWGALNKAFIALSRYHSHAIKCTLLKCTIQLFLMHLQSHAVATTNSRTLSSSQKRLYPLEPRALQLPATFCL